ncbi:MAG: hypothetical protein JXA11_02590 [Phycisphaerae bacterium]|nr:hypothetical protein [Phycisphaerae bacterium]
MDKSEEQPAKTIEEVIVEDGRYRVEGFGFLHEGLSRAVKDVYEEPEGPGHHVTGQQLCQSLRDLALERYGLMAPAVLRSWGVRESIDFGNMVYLLIEHGMMRKTEEDSVEDFRDVFNLERDFDASDSIRLKKE